MTTSPLTAEDYCDQAQTCLSAKDLPAAMAIYEKVIEHFPDHVGAHEALAAICFALKDNSRAVELFKRMVALAPQRTDALVNLGAAYNRIGNFNDAVRSLRQALARNRKCAEAYYNLGFAERALGQLSMAIAAFKEAIQINPEMWEAYINLGLTQLALNSPAQAVQSFERALRLRPESRTAREGLIAARHKAEHAKQAISPFGRLVDMDKIAKRDSENEEHAYFMSSEERMLDRQTSHQIAMGIEQSSAVLMKTLREELLPAIQSLAHHINEPDPANWCEHFEGLMQSRSRLQHIVSIVASRISALQAHEDALTRGGEGRSNSASLP